MSWRALVDEALNEPRHTTPEAAPVIVVRQASPAPPAAFVERLEALRQGPPPEGLSDARWSMALDRAEAFLLKWGASAAALGWTADALLSVNPEAWMRLDHRGALFILEDSDVEDVTATRLTVRKGRSVLCILRTRPCA